MGMNYAVSSLTLGLGVLGMAAPKAEARDVSKLCTKQRSSGRGRCRAYAIAGANMCAQHGGRNPVVRETARQRLAVEAYSSVATLVAMRDNPNALPADRIKASNSLLDRAGYGPNVKVDITRESDDVTGTNTPEFQAMVEEAKQRLLAENPLIYKEIDGVFVRDDSAMVALPAGS